MEEKTFKIIGNDISDGYHTFGELYDHRCLLWIAFCIERHSQHPEEKAAFWIRDHFDGWDLVTTDLLGKQISYHVPKKWRHLYEKRIHEIYSGYKYDGHTSADVLSRLSNFCESF